MFDDAMLVHSPNYTILFVCYFDVFIVQIILFECIYCRNHIYMC